MEQAETDTRPFEELTPTERRHRNMAVLAGRLGWPEGVAQRLVIIERCFPAWVTSYVKEGTAEVPAGSCTARLEQPLRGFAPALVAADPAELAAKVAEAEERRRELTAPCPTCGRTRV